MARAGPSGCPASRCQRPPRRDGNRWRPNCSTAFAMERARGKDLFFATTSRERLAWLSSVKKRRPFSDQSQAIGHVGGRISFWRYRQKACRQTSPFSERSQPECNQARSGGSPLVAVVQAADVRSHHDAAGRSDGASAGVNPNGNDALLIKTSGARIAVRRRDDRPDPVQFFAKVRAANVFCSRVSSGAVTATDGLRPTQALAERRSRPRRNRYTANTRSRQGFARWSRWRGTDMPDTAWER
jgi:hypothetical protein